MNKLSNSDAVYTAQSEVGQLDSVLIKSVSDAFGSGDMIDQQWRVLNYLDKPDMESAIREYELFEGILKEQQVKLRYLPKDLELSMDSVYCRDASIATDFGMILCRMGKKERKKEPEAQRSFFEKNQIPVLGEILAPGTLEGGDVAWLDQHTLAVGHTYRTNLEGISQLKEILTPHGIHVMVVELPHYKGPSDVFHLMSIFSPVADDLAVVYSPLMPINFRNELQSRGFSLVEVPEEEFETMGCNVLALGQRKCLMIDGNPKTEAQLKAFGCEVFTYEGTHISVMGGGGPTCLTRPLKRLLKS